MVGLMRIFGQKNIFSRVAMGELGFGLILSYATSAHYYTPKLQPDNFPSHEHYAENSKAEKYVKDPKKVFVSHFAH